MINQVGQFLKEDGWNFKEIKSPQSGQKLILSYLNPDFDKTLRVLILFKENPKWLYVSTHKLFKYPLAQTDVILRFLKFNAQIPLVKWLIREIKNEVFINLGFEIFEEDFNRKTFLKGLDLLSFYIDDTLTLLRKKKVLTEKNLTRITAVTKDSLELN
jgi:hypothetical protein